MANIGHDFLENTISRMEGIKTRAEKAVNQIKNDEELFWLPDGESNSIALLMKHMANNMLSRWTDFLNSDGEKADRNRPSEFDQNFKVSRIELLDFWNNGWSVFFDALENLSESDLTKTVKIRNVDHTVIDAIMRQVMHYSEHIGQIIFLSKHKNWKNWDTLSVPRDYVWQNE